MLEPFLPIAEVLGTRLPVISDLAGETITLLDLARLHGGHQPEHLRLRRTRSWSSPTSPASVQGLLNGLLAPADQGWLQLGNFSLDPSRPPTRASSASSHPIASGSTNLDAQDQQNLRELEDETGFAVPCSRIPASLFKLLMGQDVTLVTYDMPRAGLRLRLQPVLPDHRAAGRDAGRQCRGDEPT